MTQMAERAVADRAPAAMVAGAIPLIDVAGHLAGDTEASRKAATQLRWAFENVGFYYLSGHGVPPSLIERTYEAAARFHAQPMAKKLALKVNEHNIGYLPISNAASPQAAAQGRKPSQNEAYFLRRERAADDPAVITNRRFHGLNQWPGDLPGFRARALEYMQTLEALCRRLVLLYALALDLPADFFDACFAKPHMILRMSRYPVIDGEDETVASLVPHTDSGFMTLLPPNPVPGLSILLPSGRWIEAPGVEGAYVVNGGDILHRWTNERFLSTPHRVRNLSGQVRYAIPFFCDPDHDTNIECLPTCRSGDNPAKYPSIRFGDYCRIVARTREGLGQPINPHLFRDCAATSIAIDDPAHVGIASRMLGHRTGSTMERYYNLGAEPTDTIP